jgi:hypothetical protein
MDDALVVRELQRLADLRHDGQRLFRGQFPGALHLAQICPIDKFHQQIMQRSHFAEVMHGHDIGMIQPRQSPRLAIETFGKARVAGHSGRKYF